MFRLPDARPKLNLRSNSISVLLGDERFFAREGLLVPAAFDSSAGVKDTLAHVVESPIREMIHVNWLPPPPPANAVYAPCGGLLLPPSTVLRTWFGCMIPSPVNRRNWGAQFEKAGVISEYPREVGDCDGFDRSDGRAFDHAVDRCSPANL